MSRLGRCVCVFTLSAAASLLSAQQFNGEFSANGEVVATGQLPAGSRQAPYKIRHLPVSSFPELPPAIADQLTQRGCLIPQTFLARRPENVIHGSFRGPGSFDWAILCTVQGTTSLLVFFADAPDQPVTLASAPELQRLQVHFGTDVLGFNWGIDPASPERIHQAQSGLTPRPAKPDHDALADSVLDRNTIYHYFKNGAWTLVETTD